MSRFKILCLNCSRWFTWLMVVTCVFSCLNSFQSDISLPSRVDVTYGGLRCVICLLPTTNNCSFTFLSNRSEIHVVTLFVSCSHFDSVRGMFDRPCNFNLTYARTLLAFVWFKVKTKMLRSKYDHNKNGPFILNGFVRLSCGPYCLSSSSCCSSVHSLHSHGFISASDICVRQNVSTESLNTTCER